MTFKINYNAAKQDVKAVEPSKPSLEDILYIEDSGDGVIETINVFDVCRVPFLYATEKHEMLSYIQPHSVDIAMISPSKENWKAELNALIDILCFRNNIYIIDSFGCHNSDVERYLSHRGYEVASEGNVVGIKTIEYSKGYEISFIESFNEKYTVEMFSMVASLLIPTGNVIYCDVVELLPLIKYAKKFNKSVFFPVSLDDTEALHNFLEAQVEELPAVDKNLQFKMF